MNHKGLGVPGCSSPMSAQACANINGRVMPLNARAFVAYPGSILLAHSRYPKALQEVYRKVLFEVRVRLLCPKQDLDRWRPERDSEF